MVEPRVIVEGFSVAPQLTEADFPELAAAGYKTIINNRPDGEEPGQLTTEVAKALAAANGLNYVYIPIVFSELNSAIVDQFAEALKTNSGPILAHCKTGTRSCIVWSMATAKDNTMTVDELLMCAAKGGYDLSRMRPLIEQYMGAG